MPPGALTATSLLVVASALPLHTATVEVQLNMLPAACCTDGQLPDVVTVPLTNKASEPAVNACVPVERSVTVVPVAVTMATFCCCETSCCWMPSPVAVVALSRDLCRNMKAKPAMETVMSRSKMTAITGVMPFIIRTVQHPIKAFKSLYWCELLL